MLEITVEEKEKEQWTTEYLEKELDLEIMITRQSTIQALLYEFIAKQAGLDQTYAQGASTQ